MSLYYDAAPLLVSATDTPSSLKSRIFGSKELKSQPKQVYALVSEVAKWSPILVDVIEKAQLLSLERKLSPNLALLLVHDLLLAKKGISAPTAHPLRLTAERHKARLNAEFTRIRLKRGFASIEGLRAHIKAGNCLVEDKGDGASTIGEGSIQPKIQEWPHPRWVRVNEIKTSLDKQMKTTFAGYKALASLEELLRNSLDNTEKLLHVDKHVPNLIALAPTADLSKTPAYLEGFIILQDKASCFPAYLLEPSPTEGSILDACAAPGNKTTHTAAILQSKCTGSDSAKIYACERDIGRGLTLIKMVKTAGADGLVTVKNGQDFMRTDPDKAPWNTVGSLLLDPSCSGSGIVDRGEVLRVVLPSRQPVVLSKHPSKKRKRKIIHGSLEGNTPERLETQEEVSIQDRTPSNELSERLTALSTFQLKLILHAFRFPQAHRITFSTCSVYAEENEHVVMRALNSDAAKQYGWQILPRDQQISGMQAWQIRGNVQACEGTDPSENLAELAEACIRCEKGTKEGTQGFFVAAFVRIDRSGLTNQSIEEDWGGISDSDVEDRDIS